MNKNIYSGAGKDFHIRENAIIILCAMSLILASVFILGSCDSSKDIDYLEDNISRYITIPENDYKGYTLEVLYDEMREGDVDRKIMSLRYQKRGAALNNGGSVINLGRPIDAGDTVKIYYRGYTLDESGNENAFSGGCNFSSSPYSLGIGSLGFIPGFEESLLGAIPSDYSRLSVKKSGKVLEGDVIYLSYRAMLPDGTSVTKVSERINLSAGDVDEKYGNGFAGFFVDTKIGEKISQNATFEMGAGSAVYFDMTVDYATSGEDKPLTISAYFPTDYKEASLRGVSVLFDVFFEEVIAYDTPKYDEAFITGTLGVTEAMLSKYEGSGIVEKHKNMLKAQIEEEYLSTKKTMVEEAIWKHLHEAVKVKRLPKSEVEEVYEQYYGEIKEAYEYYSSMYSSIDQFASAYLGITDGADWREYIRERAEAVVTEKLIFYYIIREENLLPSDADYQARYDATVQEYLDYYTENIYKEELEAIKNEADREKKIAEIKAEMLEYYGEEYFVEMVYYEYSLDAFISLPTVVKKQ